MCEALGSMVTLSTSITSVASWRDVILRIATASSALLRAAGKLGSGQPSGRAAQSDECACTRHQRCRLPWTAAIQRTEASSIQLPRRRGAGGTTWRHTAGPAAARFHQPQNRGHVREGSDSLQSSGTPMPFVPSSGALNSGVRGVRAVRRWPQGARRGR
jgi:hypothetical protein